MLWRGALEIVPCPRLNLRVATAALGRCNCSAEHHDLAGCLICTPSTAAYVTSGMSRKETQGPTSWRIAEQVWRLTFAELRTFPEFAVADNGE